MGRGRGKRKPRKQQQNHGGDPDFIERVIEAGNFGYESYYAAQGLHNHRFDENGKLVECANDEERQAERLAWKRTGGEILPVSFRVNKDVSPVLHKVLIEELEELIGKGKVHKLEFLPNGYQLDTDYSSLKKNLDLRPVKKWLVLHTDCGNITRQETVSMIPPIVLSPKPSDSILDMCAAPGSKTSQLLEELGEEGAIVANDANIQRAYMLCNQLRRILHMKPFAAITAGDAQHIPGFMQYDKILADVPCSGDATSRKNIDIWQKWTQMSSYTLHPLQKMIAWKGAAQLLKVGGYMVYSTCSMNPIENESVVAHLLRESKGMLELVDFPLEGFRTRPGWSTWKVFCEPKSKREMKNETKKKNAKMQARRKEFEDEDKKESNESPREENTDSGEQANDNSEKESDVPNKYQPEKMNEESLVKLALEAGYRHFNRIEEVPDFLHARIKKTCFPPTPEEAKQFHLERCIRVLAHDNNTGGFFVALLKKTGPLGRKDREFMKNKEPESSPESKKQKLEEDDDDDNIEGEDSNVDLSEIQDNLDDDNKPVTDKRDTKTSKDSIDKFEPAQEGTMDEIISFYGLDSSFRKDLYMTRAAKDGKVIYFVAPSIKAFMDSGLQDRVNLVNTGLKSFGRNQKAHEGCRYRIAQEGVHYVANHMTKRKVIIEKEDFEKCLTIDQVPLTSFTEHFQTEVRPLSHGSFVAVLKGFEDALDRKMVLSMWRSKGDNVTSMVAKVEFDYIRSKLQVLDRELELSK